MITVKELLKAKGKDVWSVTPQTAICDVLKIMADKDIGAVPVVEKEKLVGIFSERDLARKMISTNKLPLDSPLSKVMIKKIIFTHLDDTIEDCMVLMTTKHVRHLPVLENGKLVGIITIGDVVKQVILEQKLIIMDMEKYITGSYGT